VTPTELMLVVAEVFERMGIPYAVSGSVASTYYGEMRTTLDVDIVADLPAERVREFTSKFSAADYYVSEDAARSAVEHCGQFNIIHPESGLKADIIIPKATEHDRLQLVRAQSKTLRPNATAMFAAPEDVIIKKLGAYEEGGSEKHLRDIASMRKVRGDEIDQKYIDEWSRRLALEDIWLKILDQIKRAR